MSTEPEEVETSIVRRESTALAHGSSWALARLTDSEFSEVLQMAQTGRNRLLQVMRGMMTEDVHFGKIPGAGDRKVLLKPGSEVLAQMFRLVCEPDAKIVYGDGVTAPHFTVESVCRVHLDSLDGPVVAVGQAAANSWEKKWRYRQADRICPHCGKPTIIKGKAEYGGGWLCFAKKGGCGAKWPDGAADIEGQQVGQIENPDPYDLLNTVVKITNKRAKTDGIVAATNSSDLFTQDLEEMEPNGHEPAPKKGEMRRTEAEMQAMAVEPAAPATTVLEQAPYQPPAETQAEADTWRRRMTACESAGLVDTMGSSPQGTTANRRRWLGVALGRKITRAEDVGRITVPEWREINAGLLKRLQEHLPPPGNGKGAPEANETRAGSSPAEGASDSTATDGPPGAGEDAARAAGPAPSIAENAKARKVFEMKLDLALAEGKIEIDGMPVLNMDPITKSLYATDLLGQVPKTAEDWQEAGRRLPV